MLLTLVLLATSCTQEDALPPAGTTEAAPGIRPLEIASVGLDEGPQTRITETAPNQSAWQEGDLFGAQIGQGAPGTYRITATGGAEPATSAYWQTTDNDQTITA